MKNQYETVFILTPVLSEAQMKEAVQKFKDFLAEKKAEMVHEEHWGLKKLAYPIQKKSTGFYHLFEFAAEGELIQELELEFKRDERIMRFLTVKLDKHAVAYNEKKRHKATEKKEQPEETPNA
jgi:small subunit ribosomal protein S6